MAISIKPEDKEFKNSERIALSKLVRDSLDVLKTTKTKTMMSALCILELDKVLEKRRNNRC